MATIVDALLITMGMETSGVDRGMADVQKRINSGVKNIVSALSAPIMAALAGFSAGAAVSAYTETATGLDRLSKSLGMSMESLQGWQYAAESVGVEAEEVGNFFRDMNDYIIDATTFDSGPLKDIAKELGLSLKDAQGNIKATEDITLELADAFQRIGSQKAVAFGMQMGIDPGMIALLQKGGAAIEGLINAQKELGTYTKEDAEIASKAKFAFLTLGKTVEAAAMPVARYLVPFISSATEKLSSFVAFMRQHEPFVKAVFAGLAAVITGMLIPASVRLAATWLANPLTWIIGGLALAILAVALAIDDLIAYIDEGTSAFSSFWSMFGTGEQIINRLMVMWENFKAIIDAVLQSIAALAGWSLSLLNGDIQGLTKNAEKLWQAWVQLGNVLGDLLGWLGEKLKNLLPDWVHEYVFNLKGDSQETMASVVENMSKNSMTPEVAATEALPSSTYNASSTSNQANYTKTTTINGGINITTSDPKEAGRSVSDALGAEDKNTTFAVDTGVWQ